jgi:hypothetical protein
MTALVDVGLALLVHFHHGIRHDLVALLSGSKFGRAQFVVHRLRLLGIGKYKGDDVVDCILWLFFLAHDSSPFLD